jgi:hypothetical protein
VISPNFIGNNGWTKAEFEMIFSREIQEKEHVILPVWHNVDKQQVYNYCPSLVNRFAGKTDAGIKRLAGAIYNVLKAGPAAAGH